MRPAAVIARFAPVGVAIAGVVVAVAIAAGVIDLPDLTGALSDVTDSLGAWVYLVVPALLFLETTMLLGFLIHGELALLFAGYAAHRGSATLAAIIVLAWAASIAGDLTSFLLGRSLGRPFVERHGVRVGLGTAKLARIDGFFARHGGKALVLGRFTGFTRATMPFFAGSSGMPLGRVARVSAATALVWTTAFIVIGYAFSESASRSGETATQIAYIAVLLTSAALILRSPARQRHDGSPRPPFSPTST